MTQIGKEILELLHSIQLRPSMYGSPLAVSGMVEALAVVLLRQEIQRPFGGANWGTLIELIREATKEVPCLPSEVPELSLEQIEPRRRLSYEAFSRHTGLFLDLFESFLVREEAASRNRRGPRGA
jgi:hypothetical protein